MKNLQIELTVYVTDHFCNTVPNTLAGHRIEIPLVDSTITRNSLKDATSTLTRIAQEAVKNAQSK